jgi:hypothetical protein
MRESAPSFLFPWGSTKNKKVIEKKIIAMVLKILKLEALVPNAHFIGSLTIYPDTDVSKKTEIIR